MDNYLIRENFKYFDNIEHFSEENKEENKIIYARFDNQNMKIKSGTIIEFNLANPILFKKFEIRGENKPFNLTVVSYDKNGNKIKNFTKYYEFRPHSEDDYINKDNLINEVDIGTYFDNERLLNKYTIDNVNSEYIKKIEVILNTLEDDYYTFKHIRIYGINETNINNINNELKEVGGKKYKCQGERFSVDDINNLNEFYNGYKDKKYIIDEYKKYNESSNLESVDDIFTEIKKGENLENDISFLRNTLDKVREKRMIFGNMFDTKRKLNSCDFKIKTLTNLYQIKDNETVYIQFNFSVLIHTYYPVFPSGTIFECNLLKSTYLSNIYLELEGDHQVEFTTFNLENNVVFNKIYNVSSEQPLIILPRNISDFYKNNGDFIEDDNFKAARFTLSIKDSGLVSLEEKPFKIKRFYFTDINEDEIKEIKEKIINNEKFIDPICYKTILNKLNSKYLLEDLNFLKKEYPNYLEYRNEIGDKKEVIDHIKRIIPDNLELNENNITESLLSILTNIKDEEKKLGLINSLVNGPVNRISFSGFFKIENEHNTCFKLLEKDIIEEEDDVLEEEDDISEDDVLEEEIESSVETKLLNRPPIEKVQEYLDQIKLDFILNNFYTDKFKVISFVHKKESDNRYKYFIITDTIKGEEEIIIEENNKNIKLISPLSITLTSGYALIAYAIIFILIIIIIIK